MMRLLVLLAFVAFATADVSHLFNRPTAHPVAPSASGPAAVVLKSDQAINPDASFHYSYESNDGISVEQQGHQEPAGKETSSVVHGSYQYTAPDGTPVQIQYAADANGYHPVGNLLPVAPPIPEAILKSIEYNLAHPQ